MVHFAEDFLSGVDTAVVTLWLLGNILLNIVLFSNQARKERHLFLLQRLEHFFVLVNMFAFSCRRVFK